MPDTHEALSLQLDYQAFAYETGHAFRGLTITERPEGYNVVLRARTSRGEPVYAMTVDADPTSGLNRLQRLLRQKGGEALWRHDRFA